jgi:hypothetical protein
VPRLTLVAVVLGLLAGASAAERPRTRAARPMRTGAHATVQRVEHDVPGAGHLRILKALRPEAAAQAAQIASPWSQRLARVSRILRRDRRWLARFGKDAVLETIESAPGEVLQAEAVGVAYDALPAALRVRADADRRDAAGLAEEILPGIKLSAEARDFFYDPASGRISAWIDLLGDPRRQTFRRSGDAFSIWDHAERSLGAGWNAQVVELDVEHPAAPGRRLTVVKRYRELTGRPGDSVRRMRSSARNDQLAATFVGVLARLRADPTLAREFPAIFPDAAVVGPGEVGMTLLPGVTLDELIERHGTGHAVVARARRDAQRATELAGRVLGRGPVDESTGINNFLFDAESGRVTGWPDPALNL